MQGQGDSWVFLSAVNSKKKKTKQGSISRVYGVPRVFHSLGARVGWHFCPVDMGTGLHSFLALGWCLDGGDLGWGWGAVATWGFSKWSKDIFFFLMHTIIFCWFFFIIISFF